MKKTLKTSLLIIGLIFILYTYLLRDFRRTLPTLYTNGHIITLNEENDFAESMFVENGKIVDIGTNEQLKKYDLKNVDIVDLKGATVMPGFIDAHTHFSISMFLSEMHDLSGFKFKTNKEVWERFEQIVKSTKKGDWVICKGIDPILVQDLVPPSIEYLDKIAPDNPVLFFSQSLHNYWANTKAFELVGVDVNTPNPSAHSYYGKDNNGNLNGEIIEQEAVKPFFDVLKNEVLTTKKLGAAASKVMLDYAKNGNTTIVSAGITIEDSKPLLLFKHLSNNHPQLLGNVLATVGLFPTRKQYPRHFMYMRHDMSHLMPERKQKVNDFYDIIGVKHWYDGSPYTGSMYLNEPYLNTDLTSLKMHIPVESRGQALVKIDSLKNFIRSYHTKGWQIAIHTQGDAAINEVITVFEELSTELDFSTSRHRLEHCLLLPKENVNRLKKLHLTPSFHVNHLYYYGDALQTDILGTQRAANMLPIHTVQESNIKYSLHADQPMFESNPFRLIQTAVERKTSTGVVLGKDQRITVLEAIQSLTTSAAWQINMEDKIGSLEKGKYADFIILNQDPLKTKISELSNIKCLQTYINGNLVNRSL
ncbi:lipoprotein [Polaribacter pacificus]|uniref:Lipoprotein n=1 Tax=Polaribacter pacificus TaxID=1775173 RepID=A0A917HZ70_9FLAO|nr:amidohydrolase [Polaribacter pacificus]GGG97767.1 lipoprotein [Polaribacter pacificus]